LNAFAQHVHAADKQHMEELQQQGIPTAPPPWEESEKEGYTATIRNLTQLNPEIERSTNFTEVATSTPEPVNDPDIGKMFSKRQLQKRTDWDEWQKSCLNNSINIKCKECSVSQCLYQPTMLHRTCYGLTNGKCVVRRKPAWC